MRFVEKITELEGSHPVKVQYNGTKLVGIPEQSPPVADHYIYSPMSAQLKKHLIESYKRMIPRQLLELYDAANGCNLFWRCMHLAGGKFKIPVAQLSVYGVPAGPNAVDAIEPYNISVEDLNRPKGTPDHWLKFGNYRDFSLTNMVEYDLYVDVESGQASSVMRKASQWEILQTWDSIDECLCDLFVYIQSHCV